MATINSIIPDDQVGTQTIHEVLPLPNMRLWQKLPEIKDDPLPILVLQQLYRVRHNENTTLQWIDVPTQFEEFVEPPGAVELVH